MSFNFFYLLVQKIMMERKLRGLTISILSKQARIRQELLEKLELAESDYVFSKPEERQILKLASFLKIDFNEGEIKLKVQNSNQLNFKTEQPNLNLKENFFVFTARNFNFIFLTLLSLSVLFLVGFPAFLVVRPAEVFWSSPSVQNNILIIKTFREVFTGSTARAKSMTFGEQIIILKDGAFSLNLPQPKQAVVVPLVLTNYFNLVTEYQIVLKPAIENQNL